MTKFARVIIIFIVFISLVFLSAEILNAEYLISPLADETIDYNSSRLTGSQTASGQPTTYNLQLTTYDLQPPSVTFGQLLNGTAAENTTSNSLTEKARALLARLDNLYQSPSDLQPTTYNLQPIPTIKPVIPIPTLIAAVSNLAATPKPTYHPQLEKILADETVKQITDNNQTPTTYNLQPTTNNIGILDENPATNTYTIALLGDSMVETMGKDLPHLRKLLQEAYPNRAFILLNYGQGATDLDSGLYRLTNPTTYLNQDYLPLLNYRPHILVIESFAYNHWGGQFYDLDRQWLTIAKIIDTVKKNSPGTKIILAAAIAPNPQVFGDGKLNWPASLKWNSATITKAYLQNLVNFATSEHYPLADAYHPSLDSAGNGLERYINQGDHLHPSDEGKLLFSQKIMAAIKENKMIK